MGLPPACASISELSKRTVAALSMSGAAEPTMVHLSGFAIFQDLLLLQSENSKRRDGAGHEPGIRLGGRQVNRLEGGPSLGRADRGET